MNLPKDLPLRQRHVLIAAFLFLLGLGLYANSFQNEMFWDDDDFILKNRYIQDWKYLPQYFSENAIAGHYLLSNYWRPVLLLLFSLEWHLWQDWAPGYHIVSTCLHAVDSLLLYWLLFLLFKNQGLAFSTSLIFLIHPVQTEAVVYANAVSDSLTSLFVFLSLISYTRLRLRQPQPLRPYLSFPYLSSLILYILGLMSKETAFVLPGYLLLIESILKQGSSSFKEKIPPLTKSTLAMHATFLRPLPLSFRSIHLGRIGVTQNISYRSGSPNIRWKPFFVGHLMSFFLSLKEFLVSRS